MKLNEQNMYTGERITYLSVCLHTYLPTYQTKVVQCYTGYWFSVTFRYICQFTTPEVVRFFCLIALCTSISP